MAAPPREQAWWTPAVPFASGAVAGGVVKTFTAPLSRSTILLQTAGHGSMVQAASGAGGARSASELAVGYLAHVRASEGVVAFWKGNGTSILQKMATTGSNYFVYERLKEALRPIWKSDDDVGFPARLAAGSLAGAANVTLAYPLDVVRTNIASSSKRAAGAERWAGIAETFRLLYRTHGLRGFARGLPATQLCQGANIGLHFGIYETLNTNAALAAAFSRACGYEPALESGDRPRSSFAWSMICGSLAGLVASTLVQPLDLVRRRQQLVGSKDAGRPFWAVAAALARAGGPAALYRGLLPELCKVCLFPASGLNFYVYELVRQDIFGHTTGIR